MEIEGSDTAAVPEAGRKEATFRLEANPESMQPHGAHPASIQWPFTRVQTSSYGQLQSVSSGSGYTYGSPL